MGSDSIPQVSLPLYPFPLLFPTLSYLVCTSGASRSEPRTSERNRDFSVYIYMCVCIYLPYVILYIPVFYFNDLQI